MNLAQIQSLVEKTNREKGWYDTPRSFAEGIALIHSEVSEALEAHRKNEPLDAVMSELADIVIRCADEANRLGASLHEAVLAKLAVNVERPYRHGGRKL